MQTSSHYADRNDTIPVLIVGGGLVGLSTSLFLSQQGIASLMVERHPDTAIHPRAMGFTSRTMELFRSAGIEDAIRQVEPPVPQDGNIPLVESLVGQEFDRLQEDVSSVFAGPVQGSAIAQDLLEPILRARATQLGGNLRFSTELVAFTQDAEGITATLRERESASTRSLRVQFLVAADGSQSAIRRQLDIGQHGAASMGHFISMIFEAEIMELFSQRQAIMCFLANESIAIGSLVPYPGSAARPDLFRLDVGYDPEEETLAAYPEARCLSLIQAAIGIPDLSARLKTTLTWEMHALVADRWQSGRVFLVGDAARTQPPSGGLGGNTGIAEAHNLAWKLAAVLRGEADQRLLATYDTERRPLADYTTEQMALLSQQRQTQGSAGITVDPMIVHTGYRYNAGAVAREKGAEQLPLILPPAQWKGQPGTYAPHLRLTQEGQPFSVLDLPGQPFVLLVGADGSRWKDAAHSLQNTHHLPLDSYQVGGVAGDLVETEQMFTEAYGITTAGAVLIRPDGFIGWRSQHGPQEAEQELIQALSALLGR